jgi:hypothetical protein
VQDRKGRSESSVLHSADITKFSLRKSNSESHINVTVNCIDICITPDIYLGAREEWGGGTSVLQSAGISPFCLINSSSGSQISVTVNCIDVCITADTYLCSSEEG